MKYIILDQRHFRHPEHLFKSPSRRRDIERIAEACGSVLEKYQRARRVRAVERSPFRTSGVQLQASLRLISLARVYDKKEGSKI